MLLSSARKKLLLFVALLFAAVVISASVGAVMAESGGGMCQDSTDNVWDFNPQPIYNTVNGTQQQTGYSFDYTSPYENYTGAQIEVQWTAYNSSGYPVTSYTSPFENAEGTNNIWEINDYGSPSSWAWIDASVTFTAPGQAQKYGHAKGYNLASPGC